MEPLADSWGIEKFSFPIVKSHVYSIAVPTIKSQHIALKTFIMYDRCNNILWMTDNVL